MLQIVCNFLLSESLSEAVKVLKVGYLVKAIQEHKMDQAIIFCRTKLDCDNVENYLLTLGGGRYIRETELLINPFSLCTDCNTRRKNEGDMRDPFPVPLPLLCSSVAYRLLTERLKQANC